MGNFQRCVFLILASICFVLAQQNLMCYDCDPSKDANGCVNPANSSVASTNCNTKYNDKADNDTLVCVSAYVEFKNSPNETGIYRGCQLQYANVDNFCDWFREERQSENVTVVSCRNCNTTRCNTHLFNERGEVNGRESVVAGVGVLILSLFLARIF